MDRFLILDIQRPIMRVISGEITRQCQSDSPFRTHAICVCVWCVCLCVCVCVRVRVCVCECVCVCVCVLCRHEI